MQRDDDGMFGELQRANAAFDRRVLLSMLLWLPFLAGVFAAATGGVWVTLGVAAVGIAISVAGVVRAVRAHSRALKEIRAKWLIGEEV